MNLFNQKYELDPRPIEEGCQCPACRHYSRAYIRHLLKAKEMLGMRLCVLHNLYFYNNMMTEIRNALDEAILPPTNVRSLPDLRNTTKSKLCSKPCEMREAILRCGAVQSRRGSEL